MKKLDYEKHVPGFGEGSNAGGLGKNKEGTEAFGGLSFDAPPLV